MAELSIAYFAERVDELRRDWPLLITDADIGQRLFAEVANFDQTMRDLLSGAMDALVGNDHTKVLPRNGA